MKSKIPKTIMRTGSSPYKGGGPSFLRPVVLTLVLTSCARLGASSVFGGSSFAILALRSSFFPAFEKPRQLAQRIVELIDDALFQRNDSVIGDRDALRANFSATLGDVAVTDAVGALQFLQPVFGVQRVHLQGGRMNQKARTDESLVQLVLAQHVANVLA